jgi:hypothetical protein
MAQNVIFLVGSALQTGATKEGAKGSDTLEISADSVAHHFAGRVLAGIAIGGLTHVVPMYIAEVSKENSTGNSANIVSWPLRLFVDLLSHYNNWPSH